MLRHENGSNFVEWHATTKYIYSFTKSPCEEKYYVLLERKTDKLADCLLQHWPTKAHLCFLYLSCARKLHLSGPSPPFLLHTKPTINLSQSFNSRIPHDLHHIPEDFCPPLQQYRELTRWRTLISPPGYIINFFTACSSLVSTLPALDSSISLSSDWIETRLPEH